MGKSINQERNGEAREQFSQAIHVHSHAMFRAARAVLDSDADTEDAVSEVVLRARQAWGSLRKRGAVKTWLLKITVNCANELRRKTGRTVVMEDLENVAGAAEDRRYDGLWDAVLALSPGLREALAEALGGFEPYMQEIDGVVCVENGIEIKVISAVADSYMTRVYAEARDLEGDRLTADLGVWGMIERTVQEETDGQIIGFAGGGKCVGFDVETGTALLEFKTWGNFSSDLGAMKLLIFSLFLNATEERIGDERGWVIDLNVEVLPRREIALSGTVDGAGLRKAEISALGTMLVTEGKAALGDSYLYSAYFKDGTVVHPHANGGMATGGNGPNCTYLEFEDPVDPEQVIGISIGCWMIPFGGDAFGEGYWLPEAPK